MPAAPYIGRLAPSPTGLLHLGHAATFVIAHDRARAAGGRLLLRIDDLDPHRSREPFTDALREDLRWLGLTWDAELRQSERLPLYREAVGQLLALGLAYPCHCSRKDLLDSMQAPHEDTQAPHGDTGDEPVYAGRCRPPSVPLPPATLQPNTNYRVRVPDGETLTFVDGHCGPQAFLAGCGPPAAFGDFLVWRKDGLPSYQLACAVDDAATGITEVVRGRDLLKSTARQIVLGHALGLPTPRYFHTDLVRDAAGERLAKRHDALSLRALRAAGLDPAAVRARL